MEALLAGFCEIKFVFIFKALVVAFLHLIAFVGGLELFY